MKVLANVGDTITYQEKEYTVECLAYRDSEGQQANSLTGELQVLLGSEGAHLVPHWVPYDEVILPASDSDGDSFFSQDYRSPHLTDLGYGMLKWSEGLEDRPDNTNIPPILSALIAIQYDKEGSYGSSWKGKGEYRGIMSNIDRKYDRLDKMTDDELKGLNKTLAEQEKMLEKDYHTHSQEIGESKVDAIADLVNYGILYLTYVRENYPKVFQVWLEHNIPVQMKDKLPLLGDIE